jgi:hypothetical protein
MKSFYQGAKAALEAGLSDSIAANIVLPKLGTERTTWRCGLVHFWRCTAWLEYSL